MSGTRARWAAIGAAVAVTFGAGGFSLGQAAISSGSKPVFVAITPCRLVDTRPGDANVGSRNTPLGAADTLTLQVTGSAGQCTGVPADATAVAMNVTAIQGSARSFLTVYPAGTDLPNASNLNWNGGDPPTPNKVDVKLSNSGAVNFTNDAGTVHLAADLVGYYIDHTHDDRYYTKPQLDAARQQSRTILGADAHIVGDQRLTVANGCSMLTTGTDELVLPLDLPTASVVTGVDVRVNDGTGDVPFTVRLELWTPSFSGLSQDVRRSLDLGSDSGVADVDLTPVPLAIAMGGSLAVVVTTEQPGSELERNGLCSVTVEYTLPAP